MILLLDNLDSFSYTLYDYICTKGLEVEVVRNTIRPKDLVLSKYSGLVISPGPGSPESANYLSEYLGAMSHNVPVLGVCLGHQAITTYFGGTIKKGIVPMHGKISTIDIFSDPIFKDVPEEIEVVRYHSLQVAELPGCLNTIAETKDKVCMAIAHKDLPIWGLQFHPEAALTKYGHDIIRNWAIHCFAKS